MHRFLARSTKACVAGFHTSASRAAITRFNMPAMSPTMTEGTIHEWKVKEGESFSAGDVLLELETDKAQIDVEAPEDGVLAKIVLGNGEKAAVNSPIALLAEEGDDLSNVEMPAEESTSAATEAPKEEPKQEVAKPVVLSEPMDHHDLDTSKLKKPLSPAVLCLVLKHHIKDLSAIKASGPGGRILKGDVLAHLGLIKYQPAPKPTTSAAPPRDQIVFAKCEKKDIGEFLAEAKEEKPLPPNYISKQVTVDNLFALRQQLNSQNRTNVSVNDFIAKAAARALQDTVSKAPASSTGGIVHNTNATTFSESYKGGSFKVFNLAPPTYDFITDSYESSKPYQLNVSSSKPVSSGNTSTKSSDDDMLDLIGFLAGEQPQKEQPRAVRLTGGDARIDFSKQSKAPSHQVELKLQGGAPGKILNDQNASVFLDRVEYYVRNPSELTV
ncbi:hypothetical protein BDA99DRAFT_549281 [Phascolomyces articulosus]|uniref:Dihydrolipoamide acetyltransferase component of pyruvate dehydrogenase complex n=1 Tax=Phascolomyces articulosus TaxID=60185 RepID=A0AAD5P7T0_9FUNG|nr:hypothetical protein BDA99DRAFT_549281 [Phascolomyces articulosus]